MVVLLTVGQDTCSKTFQGLHKALERGNKMFQKFLETHLLKKSESMYSPINRQIIGTSTIKKATSVLK